jgi:NADPH:quinone reductase-like Zn-dependent oxidoreductase
MVGARPIALTRTSEKRQRLLELGADAVIATAEEDVVAAVQNLVPQSTVRVIFDPVGGPDFAKLAAAAAPHAMIVLYGALSASPTPLPVMEVLGKHLTIRGFELFEITTDDQRLADAVNFVRGGLETGALAPVIDATFGLDDIVEAYRYLERGGQVGKVVVTVP